MGPAGDFQHPKTLTGPTVPYVPTQTVQDSIPGAGGGGVWPGDLTSAGWGQLLRSQQITVCNYVLTAMFR